MKYALLQLRYNRKRGNLQYFESLAFPLMNLLYSTAFKLTRDPLDAEDLVQETYLKAWRGFPQYKHDSNFRGWLFRILVNNFINLYKSRKKRALFMIRQTGELGFDAHDSGSTDPSIDLILAEEYKELFDDPIATALDRLPLHYRMVILLASLCKLSYKEIAVALGCPIGTVMSRMSRGRKILAKSLKRYAVTNGYLVTSERKRLCAVIPEKFSWESHA